MRLREIGLEAVDDRLDQLREDLGRDLFDVLARDRLTNLYGPHAVAPHLREFARKAESGGGIRLALLFVEVDHFKNVNATFGQLVGDVALRAIAQALERGCGLHDGAVPFRLGGDEFLVLLLAGDDSVAVRLAEDLRGAVQELDERYPDRDGHEVACRLRVSVGLAIGTAADQNDLQARAELAVRQAKNDGGNRVEMHRADMRALIERRYRGRCPCGTTISIESVGPPTHPVLCPVCAQHPVALKGA